MKKTLRRRLSLSIVMCFVCTFFVSNVANAQELGYDLSLEAISENERYIQENYIELFEQKIMDYSNVEDADQIESISDTGEVEVMNAISCIIQDEQLLPESNGNPTLYVLTRVTAISEVASGSGDQGNGGYDPTQCVYLYTRMYYSTNQNSNGNTTYKMTKVEGNYAIHHSAVGVISQYVWYGQNSGVYNDNESGSFYPSSTSWSKNTSFSNYCFGAGYGLLGLNYQVNLKNYNSGATWTFTLYNNKTV